jgi:hypothetical protein
MPFDETRSMDGGAVETSYDLASQVGSENGDGPSIGATTGAAFRQSNLIGSLLSSSSLYEKATGGYYDIDRSFNPLAPENIAGYEEYADKFVSVYNKRAADAVKADIDQEIRDRNTIAQSGWAGIGMSLIAGVADPTILLPGGALVEAGRGGYSLARSAANAAIATAGAAAIQEAGFQLSQQLRTGEDALTNIGGSALLGGALGGSVAALMSKVEHVAASKAMKDAAASGFDQETNALHQEVTRLSAPQAAGAQAVVGDTLDDLSISGGAASAVAKATARLNPLLRTLHSPSTVVRQTATNLMETPVYLRKNLEGGGDAAAETFMHEYSRGAVVQAIEAQRRAYADARKAGLAMTEEEFRKEVGRAMRRGDESAVPGASEAAKAWRSYVIDPLKDRAIQTGLLPADVEVTTADSYFTRMWNRLAIEANEPEFRQIVREWASGAIDNAVQTQAARSERRIRNLDQERGDLEMGILRRKENMKRRADAGNIDLGGISEEDVVGLVKRFNNGERPKAPQSLSGWIKAQSDGIYDPRGELTAIFPDAKKVPGLIRKAQKGSANSGGGDTLDGIALRAWQEGFLDHIPTTHPTGAKAADLLDALETDLRGSRIVRAADREAARAADDFDRMIAALDRIGVDFARPEFGTSASLKDIGKTINTVLGDMDRERIGKLEDAIANASQRGELDFVSEADREAYLDEIVDDIFSNVTGRGQDGTLPPNFTVAARGPLKERTFNIPDKLVERFLNDDVELVGRRYARVMAADTELASRFGSPDMKGPIAEVRAEYQNLRQTAALDPKKLSTLNAREKSDIRDLEAVRDMLRGNYRPEIQHTNWARILQAAGAFNYMRAMGGVLIGSLTDAVRPAMVHGMKAYFRDGIRPLVKGVKAAKLSKQEAKLAGAISERVLASRMATLAEITDPYANGSPFERFLENLTVGFTKMTGLNVWDDFQKTLASRITQNRILANAVQAAKGGFNTLPAKERAFMGYLGIGQQRAEDIGRLFARHGDTMDGVMVANTEAWGGDPVGAAMRRAYRAAINKDVDSIIVTKGYGDVPLLAGTPIGRALIQFKSFAIASNQRVLIRGLQEDKSRLVGGIVGMATIGAFIYALKQIEAGREVSDNPGTWAAEGLDRSGIFAVGFEINNMMEKLGAPGVYTGAAAFFPNASQREPASRYATRSIVGGMLGPTYELASDVIGVAGSGLRNAVGAASGDAPGFVGSDVSAVRRLTPFASLPYWRWLIDGFLVKEAREATK